jgi:hypothetical protein
VDALAASLWCLLTTRSFEEAILSAVNFGDDTDTTAAMTGALAGISYGLEAVHADWRASLARRADLDPLFNAFVVCLSEQSRMCAEPRAVASNPVTKRVSKSALEAKSISNALSQQKASQAALIVSQRVLCDM